MRLFPNVVTKHSSNVVTGLAEVTLPSESTETITKWSADSKSISLFNSIA